MTRRESLGRMETLNGVQLYFEVHGTGEALMLLHGFSGSSQALDGIGDGMGTQFQLIVPDLRGHGRSSSLSKPFRHEEAATDMLALLDHLGIAECKGVGVSGGGNVSTHGAGCISRWTAREGSCRLAGEIDPQEGRWRLHARRFERTQGFSLG